MDKAASAGHSDRCRIVVDTCCDFSPEVAANLDVDILGFPFIIDGEERTDDIWSSITPKEFYDRMRAGARVSTSAVSLGRYIEFFTECAKEGTPTVYLCFTSALSSSYNSACQAADAVRAEYPDFELYVVDNALPCATGELLALEAVDVHVERNAVGGAEPLAPDRPRFGQEAVGDALALGDGGGAYVSEAIVVAMVAAVGGELREALCAVLPAAGEELVQLARFGRVDRGSGCAGR